METPWDTQFAEAESRLWSEHALKIRAAKPRFEALISEITGWQGVGDLAELTVRTLINNQGGSGGMPWRTRCACGNRPLGDED